MVLELLPRRYVCGVRLDVASLTTVQLGLTASRLSISFSIESMAHLRALQPGTDGHPSRLYEDFDFKERYSGWLELRRYFEYVNKKWESPRPHPLQQNGRNGFVGRSEASVVG